MQDFIWLKTSDAGITLSKKFRVIAPDYDDGTIERSEDFNKTIGGGFDQSVGAIYKRWGMVIRVRHTEPLVDYGDMDDLVFFYSLNNPNGNPSNKLTLIDHHETEYQVYTSGNLTKSLMGCQIEGECAWYIYGLEFIKVQ